MSTTQEPTQYDNEMRGVLFPEDKARYRNPNTAPDFTGYVQINGTQYRLAGWRKQGRSGPLLSLAVSLRQTQDQTQTSTDEPQDPGDFLNVS